MSRDLSTLSLLDDASAAVGRVALPWIGVLWLTALPYRLLEVHFLNQLVSLGDRADRYGDYLWELALVSFIALLPALYGRLVWVRAIGMGLSTTEATRGRPAAVPPSALATYTYTALVLEVLFHALVFTVVAPLLIVLVGGLAAATALRADRPRLLAPLVAIVRPIPRFGATAGLLSLFALGWLLAFINVVVLFQGGLLLATATGVQTIGWAQILSFENPLFLLLVLTGTILLVEPFWLALATVLVHHHHSRETGDDLRHWFEDLRTEGA